MAHFAKVENGVVAQVIVVRNEDILDADGVESEAAGQAYIAAIGLDGDWVQTSYNGNFRGKYAGLGFLWDGTNFVAPVIQEPEPPVVP